MMLSVNDVPGDQGGQVRLRWQRAGYDAPNQAHPITGYSVYRRQGSSSSAEGPSFAGGDRLDGWDYLQTVPATGDTVYQCLAPTLCDSTVSGGLCLSSFLVRAMTDVPFLTFDSAPMNGYSVDNLTPGAPTSLQFVSDGDLVWDDPVDEDFAFFSVLGLPTPVHDPATATWIVDTVAPACDLSGAAFPYYYILATDFAGNAGPGATIASPTNSVGPGLPESRVGASRLVGASPNPFNPRTVITFEASHAGPMTLRVFDLRGRLVRDLFQGISPAGVHSKVWDGRDEAGGEVATGVYLVRMESGNGGTDSMKIVLAR